MLIAYGSFSPITYLHMRLFKMAHNYMHQNTRFGIVGGYLSPVRDKYKNQSCSARCTSVYLCPRHAWALHAHIDDPNVPHAASACA